jgi:uncharacterized protein (DUF2267 family)
VADQLQIDDRRIALHVLRGVLHALRDRLPIDAMAHLSAQLPLLIRGLYFEKWDPHAKPARHGIEGFVDALEHELRGFPPTLKVEDAVRAAFAVLGAHISLGEWRKIAKALPQELATLWDESGA